MDLFLQSINKLFHSGIPYILVSLFFIFATIHFYAIAIQIRDALRGCRKTLRAILLNLNQSDDEKLSRKAADIINQIPICKCSSWARAGLLTDIKKGNNHHPNCDQYKEES